MRHCLYRERGITRFFPGRSPNARAPAGICRQDTGGIGRRRPAPPRPSPGQRPVDTAERCGGGRNERFWTDGRLGRIGGQGPDMFERSPFRN
jgi:hypothetical protein